jgi:hypothetical protein
MTTRCSDVAEIVVLGGGLAVPEAALEVLWQLEARGFALAATEDGLRVSPGSRLTAADAAAIRAHRDELLRLVRFCERVQ